MATYHKIAPEFAAILAEDLDKDSRVIARVEFHGTHDGWHAHSVCCDFDKVLPGIVIPNETTRIPSAGAYHRHMDMLRDKMPMNDDYADAIVGSLFRIDGKLGKLSSVECLPWKI